MRERTIETALVREGERRGALVVKLTVLGWTGWPDRLCLAPGGRVAFVELKAPGETPKRHQRIVHKRLRRLGFRVAVVDRSEDAAAFFQEWLG